MSCLGSVTSTANSISTQTSQEGIKSTKHYSRFEVFLSKIGMHVKTVQIEFFQNEFMKSSNGIECIKAV